MLSQEFLNVLYSHHLMPNITNPTRVTKTTATLIDNTLSNDIAWNEKPFTGTLYSDISDHYPIFFIDHSCSIKNERYIDQEKDNFTRKYC